MVKGQYVRLHTDDEWDGLYGIICEAADGHVLVFCVAMPLYKYYVRLCGDEARVLEIVG
jgi:hypothetical protein